jgi:predicted transcriptional regulator
MPADPETVRRGLLAFTKKKGGSIPMRELHTHSLLMFQVTHQAFSQVMEGLVGDGYIFHDPAAGTFNLTESGEAWLQAPSGGS